MKVTRGKGLLRYRGQTDISFQLKSITFGAQIGGASEWGIGVVRGLSDPSAFGGDYKGTLTGATAGEASVNVATLHRTGISDDRLAHRVHLIGSAKGLSANAGQIRLKIIPKR